MQYQAFQFVYLPVPALDKQVTKPSATLSFAEAILKGTELQSLLLSAETVKYHCSNRAAQLSKQMWF